MLFYGKSVKFWMSEDCFEKRKKASRDPAVYIAQYICPVIFLEELQNPNAETIEMRCH
jgi:hypothetical protein